MRSAWKVLVAAAVLAALPAGVRAGWGVGIRIGVPIYPAYGYYRPYPYYYYPPPVVVAPPPVVVAPAPAPAPVVVQPPAPGQPPSQATALPAQPEPIAVPPTPREPPEAAAYLARLQDADERVRAEAALQLGRLQVRRAIDPLSAMLASDRSAVAREAAARALGLIGAPNTLPILQRAAQADDDREVRASARFAVDTIRDHLQGGR